MDSRAMLMKPCIVLELAALCVFGSIEWAAAQSAAVEPWVLTDGRIFQAEVKHVEPGRVVFKMIDGREDKLETSRLSERSRKRLAAILGLDGAGTSTVAPAPVAATPTAPMPVPAPAAATAPASAPDATPAQPQSILIGPRDPMAVDVTEMAAIEQALGREVTVVGKVKRIATLGASGHKKVEFEGSAFALFVRKEQLEKSADWNLELLVGKQVQARGQIEKYKEQFELVLWRPSQMSLLE